MIEAFWDKKEPDSEESKPIEYDKIKVGDKIRVAPNSNHILECQDGFQFDLSSFVTVWKSDNELLMAGRLSLKSYKNRQIEKL